MFAGLAVMLFVLFVNGFAASAIRKYQLDKMEHKDRRVKAISEVLGGIKV